MVYFADIIDRRRWRTSVGGDGRDNIRQRERMAGRVGFYAWRTSARARTTRRRLVDVRGCQPTTGHRAGESTATPAANDNCHGKRTH